MGNEFGHSGQDDVPRPSEAYEQEVIRLKQLDDISYRGSLAEDYFVDNLSEAYTDDELNDTVHSLMQESRGDMALAQLLVTREKLRSRRHHPIYAGVSQDTFDEQLAALNLQIEKRKHELDNADTS